jgi:acetoin utilization deacetylase AcuC-like enzyme
MLLEGGYSLEAIAAAVTASCQVLSGQAPVGEPLGAPPQIPTPALADQVIAAAREIHHL